VHFGAWQDVKLYRFEALAPDQRIEGPAVVESATTTILLRPADHATFDGRGWLDIAVATHALHP
jgi:N-methylhydantoinase A